jgi:hypothetical protein
MIEEMEFTSHHCEKQTNHSLIAQSSLLPATPTITTTHHDPPLTRGTTTNSQNCSCTTNSLSLSLPLTEQNHNSPPNNQAGADDQPNSHDSPKQPGLKKSTPTKTLKTLNSKHNSSKYPPSTGLSKSVPIPNYMDFPTKTSNITDLSAGNKPTNPTKTVHNNPSFSPTSALSKLAFTYDPDPSAGNKPAHPTKAGPSDSM